MTVFFLRAVVVLIGQKTIRPVKITVFKHFLRDLWNSSGCLKLTWRRTVKTVVCVHVCLFVCLSLCWRLQTTLCTVLTSILRTLLGDCWLAAVASLSTNGTLMKQIIPLGQSFQTEYAGQFCRKPRFLLISVDFIGLEWYEQWLLQNCTNKDAELTWWNILYTRVIARLDKFKGNTVTSYSLYVFKKLWRWKEAKKWHFME